MPHRFPPLLPQEALSKAVTRRHHWISAPLPLGEVMILAALVMVFVV